MSFERQLVAQLTSKMIMLEPRRICALLADDARTAELAEIHANTDSKRAMLVTSLGVRVIRIGAFGLRYRVEYSADHDDLDVVFADQSPAAYGARTVVVLGSRNGDYTYEVGLALPEYRPYSDPTENPRAELHAQHAQILVDAIETNRVSVTAQSPDRWVAPPHVAPVEPPGEAEGLAHRVLFNLSRHPVADPGRPFDRVDDLEEVTRLVRDITQLEDRRHSAVAVELERFVADAVSAGMATFDDLESLMHLDEDRHGDAPAGVHSFAMSSLVHRDEFGGDESGLYSMWKTGEVDLTDLPVELAAWFGVCGARMARAGLVPPIPPP
jgi:hypothetical protein